MYVNGIDGRPPMMSGYPRRDGRGRSPPRKRKPTADQEDRVELSPAAQALVRQGGEDGGEDPEGGG